MKITFNAGFPKGKKKLVDNAIPKAFNFMKNKYPSINFDEASVSFSNHRHGSIYYNADETISVSVRDKLILYKKVTAELTTPHGGLLVGCEIQTTCAIIHELTHYVQGIEKRLFSEVETTSNEIEYLKLHEPFWYGRLVPIR